MNDALAMHRTSVAEMRQKRATQQAQWVEHTKVIQRFYTRVTEPTRARLVGTGLRSCRCIGSVIMPAWL